MLAGPGVKSLLCLNMLLYGPDSRPSMLLVLLHLPDVSPAHEM